MKQAPSFQHEVPAVSLETLNTATVLYFEIFNTGYIFLISSVLGLSLKREKDCWPFIKATGRIVYRNGTHLQIWLPVGQPSSSLEMQVTFEVASQLRIRPLH